MDRIFLLFFYVLIIPNVLCGQFSIGLMGGGGLGSEQIAKGAVPFEIGINDYLSIASEIGLTVRQNQSLTRKISSPVDIYFLRQSYLEVPIALKAILPTKEVQPYLGLGIQMGYGLKIWYHFRDDRIWMRDKIEFDSSGISRLDFGISIGGGLERRLMKKQKLFLDLRYYLGLLDIDRDADSNIYNQGMVLSIGCLFPIYFFKEKKR